MTTTDERPTAPIDSLATPTGPEPAAAVEPAIAVEEEAATSSPSPQPIRVPTRTLPVLALLLVVASIVALFCRLTVHNRTTDQLQHYMQRPQKSVAYWLEHGYFNSGGITVRTSPTGSLYFYTSSPGGFLISTYLVEKVYSTVRGRYSWRLQALHNQILTLLTAALLGVLGVRIATRFGSPPLHALFLGGAIVILHYTFPAVLAEFWEVTGREFFLLFAAVFLLIEIRIEERRTRFLVLAQAVSAFLLTYMEYIAGLAFIASYVVIAMVLQGDRATLKRAVMTCVLPAVLAVGVFGAQRSWVNVRYPDIPKEGSTFLFRSGLDGSATYYISHLDIAYGRKHARANFPPNQEHLFRWKWMFFAGTAALLVSLIAAMRGRVPQTAIVALLSLLGSYLLYAAVFSQAVVIHPYLYDIMIYTPLVFALCVIAPSLIESMTGHRGVAVIAVFFLAIWVSMVQMRDYALWYPPPPPAEEAPAK